MPWIPGAIQKPLTVNKGRRPLPVINRMNAHVAVSEAPSLHPVFNRPGQPDSHAYIRRGTPEQLRDGLPATIEQYVGSSMRANADLEGNDGTFSVETQGGVHNADTEPWDAAQVRALAHIFAWLVTEHGVARKIASSSHLGEPSKGLSWHRLGVDGNFPGLPDIRAGRTQRGGGMRYSTSRGKLCPGGGKIQQIPEVFAQAMALLGAATPVVSPVAPPALTLPPLAPLPPVPATNPHGRPLLDVDGFLGQATIREWQAQMGTPIDGVISTGKGGSSLVRAVQTRLIAAGHSVGRDGVDGFGIYPNTPRATRASDTIGALQSYLGTPRDRWLSCPSVAIEELQRRLNAGTF